jgi:hypothetical protein
MTRSYNATPIIIIPAMVFMSLVRLANCLTSQSPWALERIETITTGRPSPRPNVRKVMNASIAEMLDSDIAIVKGRMESKIMTLRFDEQVAERTKRTMQYMKEHEAELEPRTITIELRKEDNFLSTASRVGIDLKWYSDESKERGGSSNGA